MIDVAAVRINSGLTYSQIGKAIGVSRHAVRSWEAGAPMGSTHAARFSELADAVSGIEGPPEDVRSALLSSGVIDAMRRNASPEGSRIHFEGEI